MTKQEEIKQLEARLAELKKGKTWEDLCTVSGWCVNSNTVLEQIRDYPCTIYGRNIYATKEQAEAFGIAAPQLTQLVKDMRGGWEPDWANYEQDKYCPNIDGLKLESLTVAATKRPFALPTHELCNEFIKLHSELLLTYFNGTTS